MEFVFKCILVIASVLALALGPASGQGVVPQTVDAVLDKTNGVIPTIIADLFGAPTGTNGLLKALLEKLFGTPLDKRPTGIIPQLIALLFGTTATADEKGIILQLLTALLGPLTLESLSAFGLDAAALQNPYFANPYGVCA